MRIGGGRMNTTLVVLFAVAMVINFEGLIDALYVHVTRIFPRLQEGDELAIGR